MLSSKPAGLVAWTVRRGARNAGWGGRGASPRWHWGPGSATEGVGALLSRGARWSWGSTRAVYGGGWQSDRLSLCASRRWPQPRVQEDLDTHPQEAGPRRPRGGGRAARACPARGSQFVFQALRLRHPQAHGPVSLSARRPPQGTLPRPGGHRATCASTSRLSPEPSHPPSRGQHRAGMGFGSTAGGRCPPGCPAGGQRLPVANKCPVVPPVLLVSVISWGPPTLPDLFPRARSGIARDPAESSARGGTHWAEGVHKVSGP